MYFLCMYSLGLAKNSFYWEKDGVLHCEVYPNRVPNWV
jgi:hypothetical protein